jgi:hypothetical protein
MSWEMVSRKFNLLTAPYNSQAGFKSMVDAISDFENTCIRDLMQLLACVRSAPAAKSGKYA